jgi:flagellar hook-length control protein FliK
MPNINIATNIVSGKTTNTASSAKSSAEDTNTDNNTFKDMLSNQMNSTNKPSNTNKAEASKEKKNDDAKETKEASPDTDETQTTITSNNVNPAILATVFQNASSTSTTATEPQIDGKAAALDLSNLTSKEKKALTLPSDAELNASKTIGDEDQKVDDDNLAAMGKSFAAIADKVKYAKPEMIDKVPQTVISNNLTTSETTDALISSLTTNEPSISSPFLQTQQIAAQAPVNDINNKFSLNTTVNAYGWTNELANKLTYIVGEKLQSAQLQLNPMHLGPIEVKIQIDNDKQTTIHFSALNADTRQALETAIPQLKSMLTDNGVNLANCTVNPDAFSSNMNQQRQQNQAQKNTSPTPEKENNTSSTTITGQVSISGSVDLFV